MKTKHQNASRFNGSEEEFRSLNKAKNTQVRSIEKRGDVPFLKNVKQNGRNLSKNENVDVRKAPSTFLLISKRFQKMGTKMH